MLFWELSVIYEIQPLLFNRMISDLIRPYPDHASLWCLKKFYEVLKGLHKTFWGTTKSVRIRI